MNRPTPNRPPHARESQILDSMRERGISWPIKEAPADKSKRTATKLPPAVATQPAKPVQPAAPPKPVPAPAPRPTPPVPTVKPPEPPRVEAHAPAVPVPAPAPASAPAHHEPDTEASRKPVPQVPKRKDSARG